MSYQQDQAADAAEIRELVEARARAGRASDPESILARGLRKADGAWSIVHAHDSVPFDPETRRAVLDSQP